MREAIDDGMRMDASTQTPNHRLRWLVGVHVLLAASPLLGLGLTFSLEILPVLWALFSLPIGSLMTLAIWIGMGPTRWLWRLAAGLAACFYLAIWPFMFDVLENPARLDISQFAIRYLKAVTLYVVGAVLIGGVFMLVGRRFKLAHADANTASSRSDRFQFSVLHVLLLMTLLATALTMMRASRGDDNSPAAMSTGWREVAANVLMFIIFSMNTVCAAFATLRSGAIGRYISLVLLISFLLGIALAYAMGQDKTHWLLFGGTTFITVIPMAVVIASLLVVRACGYRLTRRRSTAN